MFTISSIGGKGWFLGILSRTMNEQIKKMRDWAWNRARPASGGQGTDYSILDEIKGS